MKVLVPVATVFCMLLTSCGAIFNGSTKTIDVQCSPQGTAVTSKPEIGEYTCPTALELERKHSYVLTFSKEGYKSATVHVRKGAQAGIIVLDVLLTGLVGVIVDAVTGSWNNLHPDQVSVALEKRELGAVGPERIDIMLSGVNDDKGQLHIESSEAVHVRVEKTK